MKIYSYFYVRTAVLVSILLSSDVLAQTCGDSLGVPYRSVTPYSNAPFMGKGLSCGEELSPYGYKWQCVEYVKRFHATNSGPNVWNEHNAWPALGKAYKYFAGAEQLGLKSYLNGSDVPPEPDDVLVFNRAEAIGDSFGHIAVVSAVTDASVTVVEQNSSVTGYKSLPRDLSKPGYWISDRGHYPILGWLRKESDQELQLEISGFTATCADPDNVTYYYIDDSGGSPELRLGRHASEFTVEYGYLLGDDQVYIKISGPYDNFSIIRQNCSPPFEPDSELVNTGLRLESTSGQQWDAKFTMFIRTPDISVSDIEIVPFVE